MINVIGISGSLRKASYNSALLRAAIEMTPGRLGTALSQTAWLPVIRTLGLRPYFGTLMYVADASKLFDAGGRLADADTRDRLIAYPSGFADFIRA